MDFSFFKKRSTNLLGLEINTNRIKLLELQYLNNLYEVKNFAILDLNSEQTTIDAHTLDQHLFNKSAITSSLKQLSINIRHAAIALSDSEITSKYILFDISCTPEEIETQLKIDYLPEIQTQHNLLYYDYHILGPSLHSAHSLSVYLATVKKQQIIKQLCLYKKLGIKIKVIDVESHAIARACQLLCVTQATTTLKSLLIVCHFKKDEVLLIVLQENIPIYSKTHDLRNKDIIMDVSNEIIKPLHRFIAGLQTINSSIKITHIIVCGDHHNLVAISTALHAEFDIECMIANPFVQLAIADHCDKERLYQHAAQMMVCCGLAMRAME